MIKGNQESDGWITFYLVSKTIVLILYVIGIVIVFVTLCQYIFPTDFEDHGPYWGLEDFASAEDIEDYDLFASNNDTKIQVVAMIIFGNVFDDGAGIFWWLLMSESLRIFVAVIVCVFILCLSQNASVAIAGIIVMFTAAFIDLLRIVFYSIALISRWVFVVRPDTSDSVSPQFLTLFILAIIFLVFDLALALFMILAVGRKKKLENENHPRHKNGTKEKVTE